MLKFFKFLFDVVAVFSVFFLIFGMLYFASGDGMTSLVLTMVCAIIVFLAAINDWRF